MKLSDQVCTLEQARRLGKLGLKCLSHYMFKQSHYKVAGDINDGVWDLILTKPLDGDIQWPAFTVPELGQMLPSQSGMICWDVTYNDHLGVWNCRIYDLVKWLEQDPRPETPLVAYESEGDTMAEAMADTLIHCLESKLTTPEECNKRLTT